MGQRQWCSHGWVCLRCEACSNQHGPTIPRTTSVRRGEPVCVFRGGLLDRNPQNLFCGGDDLFSWLSVGSDTGFGVFPELRITHLIPAGRVRRDYLVRLAYGHSFSLALLRYMVYGTIPRPVTIFRRLRIIAHGLKHGWFSMRCNWADSTGMVDATQFISEQRLQPRHIVAPSTSLLDRHDLRRRDGGAPL
jgi:hypothetical protein